MRKINREPEAHIIELLNTIQEDTKGWIAAYFAFDRLMDHYKSDYQIKIAINLMNDLLGDRDGTIYICEDTSIYVLVRNLPKPLYDKLAFQLRYLFMDDPLAYDDEGDENPDFCAAYDLEESWQDFMNLSKRRLVRRVRKSQKSGRDVPQSMQPSEQVKQQVAQANEGAMVRNIAKKPQTDTAFFNASNLYEIEQRLRETDITQAIRRQPVCALSAKAGAKPKTVFDEMYINIAHLRQMLGIDADILSNRWLFKYLTQVLDDKMLSNLQAHAGSFAKSPVSINVNIPTLLSDRFAQFDATVKPAAKVSVVMEMQIADVFSDMAGFLLAKDTVQKLGYRVCLDGVTDLSFPQIDRKRLGFDLIKLQWNADTDTDIKTAKNKALMEAIKRCGNTRVILIRCDNEAAIKYGHAVGISLFQGRYLDGLINPQSTIQN
jgi:hypothetical protein